jgi:hypothetical protein
MKLTHSSTSRMHPALWTLPVLVVCLAAPLSRAAVPLTNEDVARLRKTEFHTHVVYENYGIPEAGSIGLIGFRFDQFVTKRLYWGPAVFGAVAGERGGFGIAGLGTGYQRHIAPGLHWDTRLLAGSGGGSGVKTGGGFLLQGVTGVQVDILPHIRAAFHAGWLDFPSGTYRTPVIGIALVFTGTKVLLPD